jgi:hypothetical protein
VEVTLATYWKVREELSQKDKLRRSYYEMLRDQLDEFMIQYTLIDSYERFCAGKLQYPFVEMRELKPRARIPDQEYECQNSALVIFLEDTIPNEHKKYIRFFDVNKTTKKNLLQSKTLPLDDKFDRNQKYLESTQFFTFLRMLLPIDYALLIQRDPAGTRDHYMLSHFHVRIDWPIADAAEDLGRFLRYLSKEIFEKGEKCAEDLQKKFFEYYGLPVMAGGRRTAGIVAAQYLRRIPCINTVYVGSSESRALMRISERGVSKSVLMRLGPQAIQQVAEANRMKPRTFRKNYQVAREGRSGIFVFQTSYYLTDYARPPDDGKLRDIKPDVNWYTVDAQLIIPKPGVRKHPPLFINAIYG